MFPAGARSAEAEIRTILEAAIQPAGRLKLGSLMADIARAAGGLTDSEADSPFRAAGRAVIKPWDFVGSR